MGKITCKNVRCVGWTAGSEISRLIVDADVEGEGDNIRPSSKTNREAKSR